MVTDRQIRVYSGGWSSGSCLLQCKCFTPCPKQIYPTVKVGHSCENSPTNGDCDHVLTSLFPVEMTAHTIVHKQDAKLQTYDAEKYEMF